MKQRDCLPLSKARLKRYGKLHLKKYRDREGLFLAEGLRTVSELVRRLPGREHLQALLFREDVEDAAGFCRLFPGKVFTLKETQVSQLSGTATSSGVFGVFLQQRSEAPTSECLRRNSFFVALDDVQDPGNVGTILRTAAWFGADAVICSAGSADRYSAKAVRSSAGSMYALSHYTVDALGSELRKLSAAGYTIVASSIEGSSFHSFDSWPKRLVLVVGNEANGVSCEVRALAHRVVTIPFVGRDARVESLNAAVSAGILMEHLGMRIRGVV